MKLFFIKLKYFFLSVVLTFLLVSCSILEYEENKNELKSSNTEFKKNKCPITKIPSKTASYISAKKYIISIKKIKMNCKSKVASKPNLLEFVIHYEAKLELKTNSKTKAKELVFPSIYIAIVNMENETVLAKMKSNIEISNKEQNLIINKKKFRFKYDSDEDIFIYFGLQ